MNVLLLAAGYATRLYPLTLNTAKPLLEVAGKPLIEWVVDQLAPIADLERILIVTNNKFAKDFATWSEEYRTRKKALHFSVINDGSNSDADKLGAIGDINFVLQRERQLLDRDLLVVAGDNLFSEPLTSFAAFAKGCPATLGVYDVKTVQQAKKYNELSVNPAGILTAFEEKPANPRSTLCGIALYHYKPEALRLFEVYINEGNNPDQPGRFIQWLHRRLDVFTFPISGIWYDIGSPETLKEANTLFGTLPRASHDK
jgi:glucose-1-phosphate thymidylyltransferase